MDASAIIVALKLESTDSDSVRANVLESLKRFAKATGQQDLAAAAHAAMPAAHPYEPPKEWMDYYKAMFRQFADPECGVDPNEGWRYGREYWQSLSDSERQARLAEPLLGECDGEKDADNLNSA